MCLIKTTEARISHKSDWQTIGAKHTDVAKRFRSKRKPLYSEKQSLYHWSLYRLDGCKRLKLLYLPRIGSKFLKLVRNGSKLVQNCISVNFIQISFDSYKNSSNFHRKFPLFHQHFSSQKFHTWIHSKMPKIFDFLREYSNNFEVHDEIDDKLKCEWTEPTTNLRLMSQTTNKLAPVAIWNDQKYENIEQNEEDETTCSLMSSPHALDSGDIIIKTNHLIRILLTSLSLSLFIHSVSLFS